MMSSSPIHSSMMYLPAGEIDNRISRSQADLRGEFNGAMNELSKRIGSVDEKMTLILGEGAVPGILQRIESKQDAAIGVATTRAAADDEFRQKTLTRLDASDARLQLIEAKMALLEIFTGTMKVVWALFSCRVDSETGEKGKPRKSVLALLSGILGGVGYLVIAYTWHVVWPMYRESVIHHKFMH